MDLNPRVLNHGRAVHGIRNLLRYGIDCKAIVWNQAAEKCTFGDVIRLRRFHARCRVISYQACGLNKKRQPSVEDCRFLSRGYEKDIF